MRDRPDLDELPAPQQPRPRRIDGLTDGEWARRRLRREMRFRVAFGLAFGFVVGMVAVWHWGFFALRYRLAAALVVFGSMALFATLFARRRDDDALDYAGWVAFTEWKVVERLPWWVIAVLFATMFAVVFLIGTVLLLGRFPELRF